MFTREEALYLEVFYRNLARSSRESIDADERRECTAWEAARGCLADIAGGESREDAVASLRASLVESNVDSFIVAKVMDDVERRVFARERRLAEHEEEMARLAKENLAASRGHQPENVIDPRALDAIRRAAKESPRDPDAGNDPRVGLEPATAPPPVAGQPGDAAGPARPAKLSRPPDRTPQETRP